MRSPCSCSRPFPSGTEGQRIATQAAEALDALLPRADAILLFDNETFAARRPAGARDPSPTLYAALNAEAAKRIGLLLRAGEAGREAAQVVVDAGEVLGTLSGQGFAAVGYAFEPLREHWLARLIGRPVPFLSKGDSYDGATRIVEPREEGLLRGGLGPVRPDRGEKGAAARGRALARALDEGVHDRAEVARPDNRRVRLRSGDYPVDAGRVGVVVLLAGLENVPRVTELREAAERERRPVQIDRVDPYDAET